MTDEATDTAPPREASPAGPSGSLKDLLRYFLYLGTFGFGGPIALAGYMQRDLVEVAPTLLPRSGKETEGNSPGQVRAPTVRPLRSGSA